MTDRRRIWETKRVTQQLEVERVALEEVKAALLRDTRTLTARLAEVEAECGGVEVTRGSISGRVGEVEAEIGQVQAEATRVGAEARTLRRQAERLGGEEAALRRELGERRRRISDTEVTMQRLTGSLLRMDYKLRNRTLRSR